MTKEIIICSAIKTGGNVIIKGHRHCDCLMAADRMRTPREFLANRVEGFITSKNRFVDRAEGHLIHTGKKGKLFSEDLY